MNNAKRFFAVLSASAFLVACSDYATGEQNSAAQNESSESPNFGSATDVVASDGTQVNTNNLNVADNGIGGPMQRQSGNYESQAMPGQTADEELARRIRTALTTGSLGTTGVIAENQLTKVQVHAQDGNVTLTGPVANEGEKQTIEKQVSGMKGVKSVRNQLTVSPGAGANNPTGSPFPRTPGNE